MALTEDPRLDPRIVHIWMDGFPMSICGLLRELIDDYEPAQGEPVYQCQGCMTIGLGKPMSPPQEWFDKQNRITTLERRGAQQAARRAQRNGENG